MIYISTENEVNVTAKKQIMQQIIGTNTKL